MPTTTTRSPSCPYCGAASTVRKGKRRNRMRLLQIFRCLECERRFTADPGKFRTYPLRTILDAISTFNLGHSLTATQRRLRQRTRLEIPERTIREWLARHRALTTYARLRRAARALFEPASIIRSITFNHRQVYRFQVHQAKLDLLLQEPVHMKFAPLKAYLSRVGVAKDFPHELFETCQHRSSTFPATVDPQVARKENHATRIAALVLPASPTNKKRHETLQRFMLLNDSVTVAVEIPVHLTGDDIAYYRDHGFRLDFDAPAVTGHIDFLQIRNGYAHILDYKPEARKEKRAHVQLTIYALALARRTGLLLKAFKCAWFDERDYFEFFPFQGVCTVENVRSATGAWAVKWRS